MSIGHLSGPPCAPPPRPFCEDLLMDGSTSDFTVPPTGMYIRVAGTGHYKVGNLYNILYPYPYEELTIWEIRYPASSGWSASSSPRPRRNCGIVRAQSVCAALGDCFREWSATIPKKKKDLDLFFCGCCPFYTFFLLASASSSKRGLGFELDTFRTMISTSRRVPVKADVHPLRPRERVDVTSTPAKRAD